MIAKSPLPLILLTVVACSSGDGTSTTTLTVEGASVECTQSSASEEPVDGVRSCEVAFAACSDDHDYSATCTSVVDSGRSDCRCLIDGIDQGVFVILSHGCPVTPSVVAEACGWM